jgi:hypothetical protein
MLVVVSHWKAWQLEVLAAVQVPVPLQLRAGVKVDPTQVAAAHWVEPLYTRQAPLPLQTPSVPQEAAPWSMHVPCGSAAPFSTAEQVPTLPATPHDMHVPVQAELQQKPCAQKPEPHSLLPAQAPPIGRLPQLALTQTLLALQSLLVEQVMLHAPPLAAHEYGAQSCWVPTTHAPPPLQRLASVCVAPLQVPEPQTVPVA